MLCNTSGVAIDENGQVLARETFRPIPGPVRRRQHRGQPLRHSVHHGPVRRFHRLRRHPGQVHRRVRGVPRLTIRDTAARASLPVAPHNQQGPAGSMLRAPRFWMTQGDAMHAEGRDGFSRPLRWKCALR